MKREHLVAMFRLLMGVGILLLMLAFLRACFSPPMLPAPKLPTESAPVTAPTGSGTLPGRY